MAGKGVWGMIGVDMIGQIRRAYFEQRRSIKEIVRTLRVSRTTVRKVVRGKDTEFKYERSVQPAPKLGEWIRSQAPGDHGSEHRHPAPDRFVGDIDAAFGEQLFDVSEAQGEAEIEPDCVLDDLRREAVARVR